ncbi:MAG: Bug family tripartite tricarboxylate transporter substrate binding protein [Burkholderiales bacterium]
MRTAAARFFRGLAASALIVSSVALAQDKPSNYPTRPIRLIVTVAPGAGADTIARAAGQMLSERFGQSVVVDNRAGGSGVIGSELVAKSAPDGYTILSYADAILLLGVTKRVPFDVLKAFEPIVTMTSQPYVLVIQPNLPIQNLKDFVAYSQKVTLTYGSSGTAGTVHLGMERLAKVSGAKLLHVPFKGTAPSLVAVMGGEIHMVAGSSIAALAAARTGKVRALAALGLTRIPSMPDLPTFAEQGLPGYKLTNNYRLFAPAGTPRPILAAINRVVSDGMHAPAMTQRLAAEGAQPGERASSEEIRAQLVRDYAEFEQQVKQLDVKLN